MKKRSWEEGKLNWLENCFQIQIFKFHLYLLSTRCSVFSKKEEKKRVKSEKMKKVQGRGDKNCSENF